MSMKDRFKDSNLLVDTLLEQKIVQGSREIAEYIAKKGELVEFATNETVISQSNDDEGVYFIIAGKVSLCVHGNKFPYTRDAGISLGEMSAINPAQARSATAIAIQEVVAIKLSSQDFRELAEQNPQIYKFLAKDLSERLNQRNDLIDRKNERVKLFVISTVESLKIARAIKLELEHDDIDVTIWADSEVFNGGDYTLEALQKMVEESDFGLAILQDDDTVVSRKIETKAPRDNVIFELGLFMGVLSRNRTYMAIQKDIDMKLASDLQGITPLKYKIVDQKPDVSNLATKLRGLIEHHGVRDKIMVY